MYQYTAKSKEDFENWKEYLASLSRFFSSKPTQLPHVEVLYNTETLQSYVSESSIDTYSIENTDSFANDLVHFYGTTTCIEEAGYILPDGRCLDFSGRHLRNGFLKWDYAEGHKGMTHDSILGINQDGYCLTDHYRNLFWSSLSFTNAIMKYSKAIRVSIGSEDVEPFIQTYWPLTKEQINSLISKYSNKDLIIDCTTENELPVYDTTILATKGNLFSLNDLITQEYSKAQENGITD